MSLRQTEANIDSLNFTFFGFLAIEVFITIILSLYFQVSAKNSFEQGSVIEYTCQDGHLLKGSPNRTCGNGGQWSHKPPKCEFFDCGDLKIAGNTFKKLRNF